MSCGGVWRRRNPRSVRCSRNRPLADQRDGGWGNECMDRGVIFIGRDEWRLLRYRWLACRALRVLGFPPRFPDAPGPGTRLIREEPSELSQLGEELRAAIDVRRRT